MEIKTGEELRASTESDISVNLSGLFGDSGTRLLDYSAYKNEDKEDSNEKQDDNAQVLPLLFDSGKVCDLSSLIT